MHETLRVTWRVMPLQPPMIHRHCSRCSGKALFACSRKFRTNAQKKRIDVWLIYRCSVCDEVWNLPLFDRVAVGEIAPETFDAITRNDPALALRHAFDRIRLLRHGTIQECSDVSIRKSRDQECERDASAIAIVLALARPCWLRLDRLLSVGLGVSRAQLDRLHDIGALSLSPWTRKALRGPIVHGQAIAIDLVPIDSALAEGLRRRALA